MDEQAGIGRPVNNKPGRGIIEKEGEVAFIVSKHQVEGVDSAGGDIGQAMEPHERLPEEQVEDADSKWPESERKQWNNCHLQVVEDSEPD